MRSWIWTVLAVALTAGLVAPGAAVAGSNPEAMLALHVGAQVSKNHCDVVLPECSGFVTSTLGSGFFNGYLTVTNYDSLGIAGVQFGIDYDDGPLSGVDIDGWFACSDLEWAGGSWPASNSGNVLTWEYTGNCQVDPGFTNPADAMPILVGVFQLTVYSPDTFSIIPRPVDGKAKVADCALSEDDITGQTPSRLGSIEFGLGGGYNPCGALVAVRPATWGSIKTLYEN